MSSTSDYILEYLKTIRNNQIALVEVSAKFRHILSYRFTIVNLGMIELATAELVRRFSSADQSDDS